MTAQPDTIELSIPSDDFEEDYKPLKEAGVEFIGEPKSIEAWGIRFVFFRDPKGNLHSKPHKTRRCQPYLIGLFMSHIVPRCLHLSRRREHNCHISHLSIGCRFLLLIGLDQLPYFAG